MNSYSQLVPKKLQDEFYKEFKEVMDNREWCLWLPKIGVLKLDGRFSSFQLRKIADLLDKYEKLKYE
jgi:hypothetical protein